MDIGGKPSPEEAHKGPRGGVCECVGLGVGELDGADPTLVPTGKWGTMRGRSVSHEIFLLSHTGEG